MKRMLVAALVALSMVTVWSPVIKGQRPAAIPRLADGKPDMQGYWTNQTFTPLERPAQWKDKATLTAEEARAFAKGRLDDLAYGAGVWFAAIRGGSFRSLLPDFRGGSARS